MSSSASGHFDVLDDGTEVVRDICRVLKFDVEPARTQLALDRRKAGDDSTHTAIPVVFTIAMRS